MDIAKKWVSEREQVNEHMLYTGIQSDNRRIKAVRVLVFPLLPHDFQKHE